MLQKSRYDELGRRAFGRADLKLKFLKAMLRRRGFLKTAPLFTYILKI